MEGRDDVGERGDEEQVKKAARYSQLLLVGTMA